MKDDLRKALQPIETRLPLQAQDVLTMIDNAFWATFADFQGDTKAKEALLQFNHTMRTVIINSQEIKIIHTYVGDVKE